MLLAYTVGKDESNRDKSYQENLFSNRTNLLNVKRSVGVQKMAHVNKAVGNKTVIGKTYRDAVVSDDRQ